MKELDEKNKPPIKTYTNSLWFTKSIIYGVEQTYFALFIYLMPPIWLHPL